MNNFIIFITLALIVYSALNYYLISKLRTIKFSLIHPWMIKTAIIFSALAFPFSYIIPIDFIKTPLKLFGYHYLFFFFYTILFFGAFDLFYFINRFIPLITTKFLRKKKEYFRYYFIAYIFVYLALFFIGENNAGKSKITEETIALSDHHADSLTILFASDLHLNEVSRNDIVIDLIHFTDKYNPDILLLGGDIIDRDINEIINRNYQEEFQHLSGLVPIYGVPGNHELFGDYNNNLKGIEKMGVKLLNDTSVVFAGKALIAGRHDIAASHRDIREKKLKTILDVNDSIPKILLDHSPLRIDEAKKEHVDLLLCGHTHYGQIFPVNLITELIFPLSWGHKKFGDTHCIVSCGQGQWGPPYRIGSYSEVVLIKLYF